MPEKTLAVLTSTRTFGAEVECIIPDSNFGARLSPSNRYQSVSDGSIRTEYGMSPVEIRCGIFSGQIDLVEFVNYVNNLRENGMRVNDSCGGHVHIGVPELGELDAIGRYAFMYTLTSNFVAIQDAIYKYNGGEARKNNQYAREVTTLKRKLDSFIFSDLSLDMTDRYYGLNFTSYRRHGTVEFRAFAGTNDGYVWAENIKLAITMVELALAGTKVTSLSQLGVNEDNFKIFIRRFRTAALNPQIKALRKSKYDARTVSAFKDVLVFMKDMTDSTSRDTAYIRLREMCAKSTNMVRNTVTGRETIRRYLMFQLNEQEMATVLMIQEGRYRSIEVGMPNMRDVSSSWSIPEQE